MTCSIRIFFCVGLWLWQLLLWLYVCHAHRVCALVHVRFHHHIQHIPAVICIVMACSVTSILGTHRREETKHQLYAMKKLQARQHIGFVRLPRSRISLRFWAHIIDIMERKCNDSSLDGDLH